MTKNEFLKTAIDHLTKFFKPGKVYNFKVSSSKLEVIEVKKTTAPEWFVEFRNEMNEFKNEVRSEFKQINSRLDNLEQDMSLIKSLPTIQKEIKELER